MAQSKRTPYRRTALFIAELGAGRGHVARLATTADILKEQGFVTVLAKGPRHVLPSSLFETTFDKFINAPALPRLRNPPARLKKNSLACVLSRVGFLDHNIVSKVMLEWDAVLRETKPAIVVGDFAPFARLACMQRIPFLMLGSGYAIPPEGPLVPFEEDILSKEATQLSEIVHRQANKALFDTVRSRLTTASAILRGDSTVVACSPIFDPIPKRDRKEYIGPTTDYPLVSRHHHDKKAIYAYLHAVTKTDLRFLDFLKRKGYNVAVYANRKSSYFSSGIEVLATLPRPEQIAQFAHAVYHSGGLGLSTASAVYGIPQILAPRQAEGRMTTTRLEALHVGKQLSAKSIGDTSYDDVLLNWLNNDATQKNAERTAKEMREWLATHDWKQRLITEVSKYTRD